MSTWSIDNCVCLFGACAYGRWKWALNQVLVAPVAGEIGEVGYSPDIWTWNTWPTACGAAIPMHMYWITLLPPAGCGRSQITLHLIVMKPHPRWLCSFMQSQSHTGTLAVVFCSLIDMHGKIRGLKVVLCVFYQRKFLLLWLSALSWADRRQHPGVTAHIPTHF